MDYHDSKHDNDIESTEADRSFYNIADAIVRIFVDNKLTYGESLRLLEKVRCSMEQSVKASVWGEPLLCSTALLTARTFYPVEDVHEDINRRKDNGWEPIIQEFAKSRQITKDALLRDLAPHINETKGPPT